jgi:hypothetical protein
MPDSIFKTLKLLAELIFTEMFMLFVGFLFDSLGIKRMLPPMHSERRKPNARQPDNQRCHGLAKGDAPRKGKVDGQPHLQNRSERIVRISY